MQRVRGQYSFESLTSIFGDFFAEINFPHHSVPL